MWALQACLNLDVLMNYFPTIQDLDSVTHL